MISNVFCKLKLQTYYKLGIIVYYLTNAWGFKNSLKDFHHNYYSWCWEKKRNVRIRILLQCPSCNIHVLKDKNIGS